MLFFGCAHISALVTSNRANSNTMLLQQSGLNTQQHTTGTWCSQHCGVSTLSRPRCSGKPAPPRWNALEFDLPCTSPLDIPLTKSHFQFRGRYCFSNYWQIWGGWSTELCPHKHTFTWQIKWKSCQHNVFTQFCFLTCQEGILPLNIDKRPLGVKLSTMNMKVILILLLLEDGSRVVAVMTCQECNPLQSMYAFIRYSFMKDFTACCFNLNRYIQYIF